MYDDDNNNVILDEARAKIQQLPVEEAHALIQRGEKLTLIDIREPEELSLGYIKGSIFISGDELEIQSGNLLPNKNASVILYCSRVIRSLLMAMTLKEMGYIDVKNLAAALKHGGQQDMKS